MPVLSDAAVQRYKPTTKRRFIKDGTPGLLLVVQPSGHKSWMMRLRVGGKVRKMVLGPLDLSGQEQKEDPKIGQPLTLAAARVLATAVLHGRAGGADPIADHRADKLRQRAKRDQESATTFGDLARQFVEEHAKPKTRRWRETARNLGLVYGADEGSAPTLARGGLAERWADRPVAKIDGHDIYNVVDEARRLGMPGRAKRNDGLSDARARAIARTLSKLFAWLLQHRYITTNPSIGVWCPPAPKARERVLSEREIRWFWQAAASLGAPFGPLLKLLLLTGQRLGEVSGMRWDELDGEAWQLPGSRTKNHKSHLVPLPPLALDLIGSVPVVEDCPLVFTTTGTSPVSGWSKTKQSLDAKMLALAKAEAPAATIPPWVLHDLRRTAVTGMVELGIMPHVVEATVNHISGSRAGVAGVYNRSELKNEKAAALARWAQHVAGLVDGAPGNVVPLRKGG